MRLNISVLRVYLAIFLVAVSKLVAFAPFCQKFLFGRILWQKLSKSGEFTEKFATNDDIFCQKTLKKNNRKFVIRTCNICKKSTSKS